MFLYDTNIVSELVRPQPNSGVVDFCRGVSTIYLSVITVDEIIFGLTAKQAPRTMQRIEDFFREQSVILPVTEKIARRAGELRGRLRIRGQTRAQADMLIAATAQLHQLTVVTRNIKDFQNCDVLCLNPFQ